MLVKRRHGAGNIINKGCLLAAPLVEKAIHAYQLAQEAQHQGTGYTPLALYIHQGLHAMRAGQGAIVRDKAAAQPCHTGNLQILRTDSPSLGNGHYALRHGDDIIRADLVLDIAGHGFYNIILVRKNTGRNRNQINLYVTHLR